MKKSLIMLTLVGTIMASSTAAFGYNNIAMDSNSEKMTTIETPAEKSKNEKPTEDKKPTMTEEEDNIKKSDEKKQTISESMPEEEKAPEQEEKKPTLNETDEKKQRDTKTPEAKDEKTPGKHMRKPECENKCSPEDNKSSEKKAQ
ncbi:hypothetical protein [Clostridium sp.]|uniref:hypothetical protein n=1 Tax=Clostridium sp. TaxID=1506 RepID=UPI0032179657